MLLLDARTQRIWQACGGLTEADIAAETGLSQTDVASALRTLAEAGLITSDGDTWTAMAATWV